MTKTAKRIRDALVAYTGAKVISETEDAGRLNVFIGDAGEINLYATKVPFGRAAWAVRVLSGDLDEAIEKDFAEIVKEAKK